MTNAERKIRLEVAIEVAEKVHTDICHDSTGQFSRERLLDLVDIIIQLRTFASSLEQGDRQNSIPTSSNTVGEGER